MSKELKCYKCKKHLGEIVKGRIRNETALYCKACHNKIVALEIKPKNPFEDLLNSIKY